MTSPLRLALALGRPDDEEAISALVEAPGFRVGQQPCVVVQWCTSLRELREAVASDAVDIVLASSTMNAIPLEVLRDLAGMGRPLVLLVPEPNSEQWDGFPMPVVGLPAEPAALASALAAAQHSGARAWRAPRRHAPALPAERQTPISPPPARGASEASPEPASETGVIVAVTSGYDGGIGKTLVASSLAVALSIVQPRTILADLDVRGGAVEFWLGASPGRGLGLLAQREPGVRVPWADALDKELQPMGEPGRGQVLLGVGKPGLRPQAGGVYVERLLATIQERSRYVVCDTSGSGWAATDSDMDRVVLQRAGHILLLVRPDVQGVMRARRAIQDWPQRDRLTLVLTPAGLPGQADREEVEAALQAPVGAVLAFDARGVAAARARHRPVVCQPGCKVAPPLLDLAGRLVGGGPIALPPDEIEGPRPPWWRRLPLALSGTGPRP